MELWIRKLIEKYYKLSDVEEIFGVDVEKPTINVIIMATKEVFFRKRQCIGLPYIIQVNRKDFYNDRG